MNTKAYIPTVEDIRKASVVLDEILEMTCTIIPNTAAKEVTDDYTVVDNHDGTFTVTKN